jgi:hypothetical protein
MAVRPWCCAQGSGSSVKPANNAPVYLCLYAKLAEIARAHGYAMAVHGSAARDCDVVCIPWIEYPQRPADVIEAIVSKFAMKLSSGPTEKPHGRIAYTIHLEFGDVYFDIQFMPAHRYDESSPDDVVNPSRA